MGRYRYFFGGGCTGEIVSKEGLIFTNHHCGYDAIASSSSVEHNYLRDGFGPNQKRRNIMPGLSVQFLVKIEDVTNAVMGRLKDIKPNEITSKLPIFLTEMGNKAGEGTEYEVRIASFFKGNQFLQFTYQLLGCALWLEHLPKALANLAVIPITGSGPATQATSLSSAFIPHRMENRQSIRQTMCL